MAKAILIIGGARSGKSVFAQELASTLGGPVLFVATAEAGDDEMRQRIEAHRKARPAGWRTLETTTHIGCRILSEIGTAQTVLIDCITLLVNNIFLEHGGNGDELDAPLIEKAVITEINELIDCVSQANASFIMVTNEVGLGLVPASKLGRLYRDGLGKANQMLARHADEVYLMMAGLPLRIKPDRAL